MKEGSLIYLAGPGGAFSFNPAAVIAVADDRDASWRNGGDPLLHLVDSRPGRGA